MGTKTRIDYTAKSTKPCVTSFNFKTGDVIMKTKSNFRGKMITSSVGASNYGMLKGYSLTDGDITKSFSSTMNLLGATFSGSISQDLGNNVSNITYSDVKIELLPTELIPVAIAIVTFAATGDVSTSQRVFDYAFS